MLFKMLSAISFNLDQSKILLSGNGLINKIRIKLTVQHKIKTLYEFKGALNQLLHHKFCLTLSQTSPGFYVSAGQVF